MNVLKPALSISVLIHFLYILGVLVIAYFDNIILTNFLQSEIHFILFFSTILFAAIIGLILRAIGSTNWNS
jgi:predicted neutral ceramidase superfamily lipid hydrolase